MFTLKCLFEVSFCDRAVCLPVSGAEDTVHTSGTQPVHLWKEHHDPIYHKGDITTSGRMNLSHRASLTSSGKKTHQGQLMKQSVFILYFF